MSKPGFVQKFHENPEGTLEKYGIKGFDKDSPQIQIILAGADPEILKAIKNKDFKAYLHILEEKNYLQSDFIQQINYMMLNADVSDDTEINNKLFQVACGTAEHTIENSK